MVNPRIVEIFERPYLEIPWKGNNNNHRGGGGYQSREIRPSFQISGGKIKPNPEEAHERKEIRFKLNLLTPDNYDIIYKNILELAQKG